VTQLLGNPRIVVGVDFQESPSNGIRDSKMKVKFSTIKVPLIFGQSYRKQTLFVNNVPSVLGAGVLRKSIKWKF
jgi:hypothetical protein